MIEKDRFTYYYLSAGKKLFKIVCRKRPDWTKCIDDNLCKIK